MITAIPVGRSVGHRFKFTPDERTMSTAHSLPWWSHIQVLTEVDVP